jgi:hypothetical protein
MRLVKFLLIFAVVIGGLFVAADRVAVKFAENEAASRAQQTEGLAAKPTVSIKGFPFLTQVLGKKLDEVDVTAAGVEAGPAGERLRIDRFDTELRGVRLEDNFSTAVADTATGSVHITYADLSKAAPDGVTVSYGGKSSGGQGRVKITAGVTLPVLGTIKRSVISTVSVSGDESLRLRADSIPGAGAVPGLEDMIREKIDFNRKLAGLPQGVRLESIEANPDGISISATGSEVVLAQ